MTGLLLTPRLEDQGWQKSVCVCVGGGKEDTDQNEVLCAYSIWTFPMITAEFQGEMLKGELAIH